MVKILFLRISKLYEVCLIGQKSRCQVKLKRGKIPGREDLSYRLVNDRIFVVSRRIKPALVGVNDKFQVTQVFLLSSLVSDTAF